METDSSTAVAELYRVFRPYRIGDEFVGCDDCVSPQESARLASIALSELAVSDLNRYAFKAMTTWGTDRHFKHFLLRLLELSLDDYLSYDFPEVLLGKLSYVDERPLTARRNGEASAFQTGANRDCAFDLQG